MARYDRFPVRYLGGCPPDPEAERGVLTEWLDLKPYGGPPEEREYALTLYQDKNLRFKVEPPELTLINTALWQTNDPWGNEVELTFGGVAPLVDVDSVILINNTVYRVREVSAMAPTGRAMQYIVRARCDYQDIIRNEYLYGAR